VDNLQRVAFSAADQWLEQAGFLSLNAGLNYIDVIIDQAGSERPVAEALNQLSPAVRQASLFEGTPEEGMQDDGPVLVRLFWPEWQHKALLAEFMQYWGGASRLMLLISPLVFDELKSRLGALTQFEWGDQTGVLRFYDSRVFPALLSHVLSEEQQVAFTDIAFYWGWQDRDMCQIWKQGSIGSDSRTLPDPTILTFNDQQIENIGCISDAEMLARNIEKENISREKKFQRCFAASLAASHEGYFGELSDYIQQFDGSNGGGYEKEGT
jgi:hypothetical protein